MSYSLGVDLGTTFVAAAVGHAPQVEMFTLGDRSVVSPAAVYARDDGSVVTGEAAIRRAISNPDRVGREFKRRLGDPTPVILGGTAYPVTTLLAKVLRDVVTRVTDIEGAPPGRVVLTHPANWGPYRRELFDEVPELAGLTNGHTPRTVTEPEAAAAHYAASRQLTEGDVIAVYDLGGGTFDATVLRKQGDGIEILGTPEGIERLGGVDFDEAILSHVNYQAGGALTELDMSDSQTSVAVARLRQDCVLAKEALSVDSETTIPVFLPHRHFDVRLTIDQFEGMIRAQIESTIGALTRTLRSAGVGPDDLTAVLLVGGSSRIPLVARMLSEALERPIVVDTHPKYAVALGAAEMARAEAGAMGPVARRTPAADPALATTSDGPGGADTGASEPSEPEAASAGVQEPTRPDALPRPGDEGTGAADPVPAEPARPAAALPRPGQVASLPRPGGPAVADGQAGSAGVAGGASREAPADGDGPGRPPGLPRPGDRTVASGASYEDGRDSGGEVAGLPRPGTAAAAAGGAAGAGAAGRAREPPVREPEVPGPGCRGPLEERGAAVCRARVEVVHPPKAADCRARAEVVRRPVAAGCPGPVGVPRGPEAAGCRARAGAVRARAVAGSRDPAGRRAPTATQAAYRDPVATDTACRDRVDRPVLDHRPRARPLPVRAGTRPADRAGRPRRPPSGSSGNRRTRRGPLRRTPHRAVARLRHTRLPAQPHPGHPGLGLTGPWPHRPGSAPPGSAPPGSAPPGSAPPGSAPPGSAPPGSRPPGSRPPGSPPPASPPPTGSAPATAAPGSTAAGTGAPPPSGPQAPGQGSDDPPAPPTHGAGSPPPPLDGPGKGTSGKGGSRRTVLIAAALVMLLLIAGVVFYAFGGYDRLVGSSGTETTPAEGSAAAPAEAVPNPTIAGSIPAGQTPGFVAVSPNGRLAYVANRGAGVVTVIDTSVNRVTKTIPISAGPPQYLAFSPDGGRVYVSVFNDQRTIAAVAVLDTASNSEIATVPVRTRPYALAVTADGSRIYVPNHDSGTISVIDAKKNEVVSEIEVAPNPHWIAFSKDGSRAYAANHESNLVSVLDARKNTVLAEVPVGRSPHSVAVNPARPLVANVNYDGGTVSMIDVNSRAVVATVPVGRNPQAIAWSPDGRFAYTANVGDGTVSVIDADGYAVTATIPTGDEPTSVAVLPDGQQAYVTNLKSGTVTVLDIAG